MTKVQLGKEKFDYNPTMDLDAFTEANECYYYGLYEQAFEDEPQYIFRARDGDTDHMREWVMEDKEWIIELMGELYMEFLSTNYGG